MAAGATETGAKNAARLHSDLFSSSARGAVLIGARDNALQARYASIIDSIRYTDLSKRERKNAEGERTVRARACYFLA